MGLTKDNRSKVAIAVFVCVVGSAGFVLAYRANSQLRLATVRLEEQSRELAKFRRDNQRMLPGLSELDAEISSRRGQPSSTSNTPADETRIERVDASLLQPLAAGLTPAKNFKNAGRATPREAFDTFQWAINGGDEAVLANTLILHWSTKQKADELFRHMPPAKQEEYHTPERLLVHLMAAATQIAGAQVLAEETGARLKGFYDWQETDPDYCTLKVKAQFADGRIQQNSVVFQRTADGWRYVFPPSIVDQMAAYLIGSGKN